MTFHCTASSPSWTTSQQHFTGNPTSSTATEQQRLDATKLLVTFSEFSVKSGGYMEGTVDTVVGSVQHLLNSVFLLKHLICHYRYLSKHKLRFASPLHLLCDVSYGPVTHFLKSEMFYWPSSHLGNLTSCYHWLPAPRMCPQQRAIHDVIRTEG